MLGALLASACGGSGTGQPSPTASARPSASPRPTATPTPRPSEPALIDGVLLYPAEMERLKKRLPLAIMVENHVAARPQFGLDKAELVYEAVAEGGITRFLAVYWRNDVERIEAVRSARVYYLDWAKELDAVFVHWGQTEDPGPADVWPALARLGIRDLNGFFLGEAVGSRDPDRPAPHNVITSTQLLWATAADHGFNGPPAALQPWLFKDDAPERAADPASRAAPAVDISFGGGSASDYAVRWEYERASNGYLRTVGGQPHTDGASGSRLAARNVAVQYIVMSLSGSSAYQLADTIGEGQAVVFQDGVAVEGTWRKPDAASRTRFYDAQGNEIAFNRGTSWVEAVPLGNPVTY